MRAKEDYSKRYFESKEDESERALEYKGRRLRGERITGNVMIHYLVITEYMKRHTNLSEKDLHLLCFLAGFYGTFDWKDIHNYPNGMGIVASKNKIKELLERELIEYFDLYHRDRDIREPYILSPISKRYVRQYNDLLLGIKKISWNPISSDEDFVSKPRKNKGKNAKNWYQAIQNFNEKVSNDQK